MTENQILLLVYASGALVGYWFSGVVIQMVKEYKIRRDIHKRWQLLIPNSRALTLSKADRRGWKTSRDGNIIRR